MAELGKSLNGIQLKTPGAPPNAWAPLRERLFRSLWIAAVVCYTGRWILSVASGWLMTGLTVSPLMVALVQAASTLPAFLILLPAGALADMLDRRRFLLAMQTWMVVAAAALGVLTLLHMVTPWVLLLFTFLIGFGAVMNDPAWQAITPEVVSEENFPAAVALNSAGYNVGRAVGPAIGGVIIAAVGTGAAFLINAASIFGVIFFLYRWKRRPHVPPEPRERVMRAMRTGFEYVRHSHEVKAVLVRTAVFSFSASGLLAMLPLIARPFGSIGYGAMLGFFGAGALGGAIALPALRRIVSVNTLVALATVLYGLATFAAGRAHFFVLLSAVLLAAGFAWIAIVASLNVSAQTMSPAWLRARSLSIYLLVLQGGMAAGSAAWGAVGERWGIPAAMLVSAIGLLLGLATIRRFRLRADGYAFPPAGAGESIT
ncbi:MAG TPA: MFS transporter [Terriglobales bacterium]|jgi:MFS family permease|nr:MFS transporter [Terriglobales bacterium]